MRGVAARLERSQEAGKTVLRFVVEREDRVPVPVEMRGDEIRGLINAGDVIEIHGVGDAQRRHGLSPRTVVNVSTGTRVEAWRLPLWRRAPRYAAITLAAGCLSAGGGRLLIAVLPPKPATPTPPTVSPYVNALPERVLIVAAVVAAAILLYAYRPGFGRDAPRPTLLAIIIGVCLGAVAVGIAGVP